MDYLPSKTFIMIVGTAFVVVLGGWLFRFALQGSVALLNTRQPAPVSSDATEEVALRDSDNDGLRDWEEVIWNTDFKKPDTDSDGTIDGEEIKLHRDPTIPAPDDILVTAESKETASKPSTISEELNHDFNIRYLTSKGLSGGASLTEEEKAAIAQSLSENLEKRALNYRDEYSEKNIVVSKTKDARLYVNNLGAALAANFKGLSGSELDIVRAAGDDPAKLSTLDRYVEGYRKTIVFLKQESVPSNYVYLHLEFLNTVGGLKYAVEEIKYFISDPARAALGIELYGPQALRLVYFLQLLQDRLDIDEIIFTEDEPGALFYKYFELQLKNQ